MIRRIRPLLCACLLLLASVAQAQYARPGTIRPSPARPGTPAPAGQAGQPPSTAPAGAAPGPVSLFCFEPMNPQDAALTSVLRTYSLLCPTVTRSGTPVRLRASGSELGAVAGPPNAWHRLR